MLNYTNNVKHRLLFCIFNVQPIVYIILMYQIILNLLKAKFEGVSENVLGRIAKTLAKTATTEEQANIATSGVTLQQVIDSYADGRATEATQTAVHNYEAKYGLKDGAKVTQPGGVEPQPTKQQTDTTGQTPEWAKALIDANKALSERIAKMEGDRTVSDRKQQISAVVSKLPETLRKPYERISLDTLNDDEFKTLVTEVTTEVEGISKDFNSKGAVFGRPSTGNQSKGDELTKEQETAIATRGSSVAEGQPF